MAAIDLGSSNVVVAVGSRATDGRVEIEEIVISPSAGVTCGEVKNVESAAASIRKAVGLMEDRLGIKITEAYTGISGNHIRCAKHPYFVFVANRDGEISREDVRKLNESMRNLQAPQGYKLMHIIPQHYVVNDDEEVMDPVGRFGKTLGSTFNLIIGEDTPITRHEKAFQKVEIKQSKLYINPLAMAEAVTFPDEKELGVAVVDIGAGTTDVTIYHDGIVRNVIVIPMGADAINKDIRSYGIMERYVEELKVGYGCAVAEMVDAEKLVKIPGRTPNDHKDISFRNLASIIEARMVDIINYVVDEIKDSGYEGRLGAGIVLTGGASRLKEIKTLFERKTGIEVRLADPNILITEESKAKVDENPAAAVAVGILWQGMNSGVESKVSVRKEPQAEPQAGAGGGATINDVYRNQQGGAGHSAEQPGGGRKPVFEGDEEEDNGRRSWWGGRKKTKEKPPKKEKTAKRRDYDEEDDLGPDMWGDDEPRRSGFMGKLKNKLNKAIDLDVLDDDDTNVTDGEGRYEQRR